eukprot:CAMPEP_0204548628 /NCGR_PEP_ID=MMETSP0661-20131031/23721_1 /ASSEMBLY_ACC=CAM_ASM_000606 /TAXON_ID=109239 /ORGANISM="Alexandrium margalefi, Strain AMGDE01CS-322" /LENGTH=55 /DNA_ID=CAMNT_0051555551 /DNA_START=44 /DNA_END=207 /DNA_ORIENTATION=+
MAREVKALLTKEAVEDEEAHDGASTATHSDREEGSLCTTGSISSNAASLADELQG